jgi:hypothetical protein
MHLPTTHNKNHSTVSYFTSNIVAASEKSRQKCQSDKLKEQLLSIVTKMAVFQGMNKKEMSKNYREPKAKEVTKRVLE